MKKLLKRITIGVLTGALMFGALGTDLGTVNVEAKTKTYKPVNDKEVSDTIDLWYEKRDDCIRINNVNGFGAGMFEHLMEIFNTTEFANAETGKTVFINTKIDKALFEGCPKPMNNTKKTHDASLRNISKVTKSTYTIPSYYNVRCGRGNHSRIYKFKVTSVTFTRTKTKKVDYGFKVITRKYKVSAINKKVKKIIIPKTVDRIDTGSFYNSTLETVDFKCVGRFHIGQAFGLDTERCIEYNDGTSREIYKTGNVKTIIIRSKKLKQSDLDEDAFAGVNRKATIKVPKKCVKKYTKMFRKAGLPKEVKVVAIK